MIKYDDKHDIGCCPKCGKVARYLDGDVLNEEMWQAYCCDNCNGFYFSERFKVSYLGYDTYTDEEQKMIHDSGQ